MSKKMLKRSLVLGALMAFVITGQAWAAEDAKIVTIGSQSYYSIIDATSEAVIINDAKELKVTDDGPGTRRLAPIIVDNQSLTVNNNISVSSIIGENYAATHAAGIRNYVGTSVFNGDSTYIEVINKGDTGQVDIATITNDYSKGYSSITFNANDTKLVFNNENENASITDVIGVFASSGDPDRTSVNFTGKTATIDINAGKNDGWVYGAFIWDNATMTNTSNNTLNIFVDAEATKEIAGIWVDKNGETGIVDLKGNLNIDVENTGVERAHGIYVPNGGSVDVDGSTTIVVDASNQNAYGLRTKNGANINLADTTITATSKNRHAYGFSSNNSSFEVYGDATITTEAGGRADGMNLDKTTVNVTGKLTVDATGKVDSDRFGAQGVRLAYSTATFTDVDISAKSTTTGKVYGIRMLGDNGATNTQLAISGNADVYAETNGVAYGIVVSTGADLGVEDDLSDIGKNLNVTVIGKEEASAIRAQYGSDINVSANTDVDIVATSESGKAYGVVNSYLTYDSANYAKANANISILGNVNIEANGKTGSYAVYNSTDYNKEDAEDVGNTIIGGEGKKVTITGDMYANSGSITTTFGAEGSQFDGKVETVEKGTTTLNFAKGATWNLTGASTLTNATFDAGSTLVIEGKKYVYDSKDGAVNTYALNGVGDKATLTVKEGAKLKINGITETTYNIAKGFANLEGAVDKWEVSDINALMQGVAWTTKDGLQVTVTAKEAEDIAEDMGVSEVTGDFLSNLAKDAGASNVKEDNVTAEGKLKGLANAAANSQNDKVIAKAAAQAVEAVQKMAEAGGNSATAANVVTNVTNVTGQRLSFSGGNAGGNKGGHGVGLLEEGSGAAIWAQYVHGKDSVEDMPSEAGASSYEGQYNGIVMGVDFKKVGKFQSGIAFNYGEGDTNSVNTTSPTRSEYDFWGIGYYGNIRNADSNVIFDIGYAKTDSDVTNNVNIGGFKQTYEASPETTTWTAGVKVEKLYQNNNVQIVPYTGLRYMSIDPDDYSTKCGALSYNLERQNIWILPVGVSIKQEIVNPNGWVVTPKVDLSYIWAFGDTDSSMETNTVFGSDNRPIGYDVMDDGSWMGLVGVEAAMDDWTFGVSYSYQKGDHSESKKWYVDAKYSF